MEPGSMASPASYRDPGGLLDCERPSGAGARWSASLSCFLVMHPQYSCSPIRALPIVLTALLALVGVVTLSVRAPVWAGDSAADAALKTVLQKRLLVPAP